MDLSHHIDPPRSSRGRKIKPSTTIVDGSTKIIISKDKKNNIKFELLWNIEENSSERFSLCVLVDDGKGGTILISSPVPFRAAMGLYRDMYWYVAPEDLPNGCWRFLA